MRIQTARNAMKMAILIFLALGATSAPSAETVSVSQTVAFRIVIPERAPLGFNYEAAARLLSSSQDAGGNRVSYLRDQYGGAFQYQLRRMGGTALRLIVAP